MLLRIQSHIAFAFALSDFLPFVICCASFTIFDSICHFFMFASTFASVVVVVVLPAEVEDVDVEVVQSSLSLITPHFAIKD